MTLISDYYPKLTTHQWPFIFIFSFTSWYISVISTPIEASRSVDYAHITIYKTNQLLTVYAPPNLNQVSHHDSQ